MFKFLLCLDFEATCWPGYSIDKTKSEIIEIGAILINTSSGEIEDRFHEFVRPTCHPILSRFCINLTGITQSKVDCSEPFAVIYKRFNDWIQQIQSKKGLRFATPSERRPANGINATFCTWSSSDLEIYMKIESERMSNGIASYFRTWIDARVYYNKRYADGRCKFRDALKRANITASGSAHSAIDDATNLAKLVMHLVHRGVQFNATTGYY